MENFGKNIKIKSKKKVVNEKDIFVDIINILDSCNKRTEVLENDFMLNISAYEEPFYLIIENLLFTKYGDWQTNIILWWVYDRLDDKGNLLPIHLNTHTDKEDKEEDVIVKTPEQLWDLLKQIEKQ